MNELHRDPVCSRSDVEATIEFERQAEARGAERGSGVFGNYVANVDCEPTSVTFANGRTVSAVGGYLSVR